MSNSPSTRLPESFPGPLGSAFDPARAAQPAVERRQRQRQPLAKIKTTPAGLISLLAKSLGASRHDWRDHRHTRIAYPSSRVSYVETKMTDEQAREFE